MKYDDMIDGMRYGDVYFPPNNREGMHPEEIQSIKAESIAQINSAQKTVRLANELEKTQRELHISQKNIQDLHSDLSDNREVLNKYVETFGEYKIEDNSRYSHRTEKTIVMPEYADEEIRFYNYIMKRFEDMPGSTHTWNLKGNRAVILKKKKGKNTKS